MGGGASERVLRSRCHAESATPDSSCIGERRAPLNLSLNDGSSRTESSRGRKKTRDERVKGASNGQEPLDGASLVFLRDGAVLEEAFEETPSEVLCHTMNPERGWFQRCFVCAMWTAQAVNVAGFEVYRCRRCARGLREQAEALSAGGTDPASVLPTIMHFPAVSDPADDTSVDRYLHTDTDGETPASTGERSTRHEQSTFIELADWAQSLADWPQSLADWAQSLDCFFRRGCGRAGRCCRRPGARGGPRSGGRARRSARRRPCGPSWRSCAGCSSGRRDAGAPRAAAPDTTYLSPPPLTRARPPRSSSH